MAEYPGGLQALARFLGKTLRYPTSARRKGLEGRVYVAFVVRKNGDIDSFYVVNKIDETLAEEALRVSRLMPKWKPGTLKGLPINTRFVLPINFKLD